MPDSFIDPTTYDEAIQAIYAAAPPGVRYVAGRPYIYDQDALNDHLAVCAKRDAPADLGGLDDEALTGLFYSALRIDSLSGGRDVELLRRCEAERGRRGMLAAFEGEAA